MPFALLRARRELAQEVATRLAEETGIPAQVILGRSRYRAVVKARHQVMVELWRQGMSTTEIGSVLDRDHTTVMHGLQKALGWEEYQAETLERHAPSRHPSFRKELRVAS